MFQRLLKELSMKIINKDIRGKITCTIYFILYGIATILSDIGVIPFSEPIPLTIVICIYLGILGNIETNRLNFENDKNGHSK